MPVACIIIKHLPCRVEMARNSGLRCVPLVIYDPDAPFHRVVDATPGSCIHLEMPLTTALARCPEALTIPADSTTYRQQWNAVNTRLRGVSDAVEDAGLGIAYAHVDADDARHTDEPRVVANLMRCVPNDWEPQIGVASDRFAAHCAARIARPGHALRVPDASQLRRRFLAPVSVNLLPVDVHILAALHDHGIRRLGQLPDLSVAGLATLANGIAPPPDQIPRRADTDSRPGILSIP